MQIWCKKAIPNRLFPIEERSERDTVAIGLIQARQERSASRERAADVAGQARRRRSRVQGSRARGVRRDRVMQSIPTAIVPLPGVVHPGAAVGSASPSVGAAEALRLGLRSLS